MYNNQYINYHTYHNSQLSILNSQLNKLQFIGESFCCIRHANIVQRVKTCYKIKIDSRVPVCCFFGVLLCKQHPRITIAPLLHYNSATIRLQKWRYCMIKVALLLSMGAVCVAWHAQNSKSELYNQFLFCNMFLLFWQYLHGGNVIVSLRKTNSNGTQNRNRISIAISRFWHYCH